MYQKAVWWAWAVSARDGYRTQLFLNANTFLSSTWDAANRAGLRTTPHPNVPQILIGDSHGRWTVVATEGLGGVSIVIDPHTMRPPAPPPPPGPKCDAVFQRSEGNRFARVRLLPQVAGTVQFLFDAFGDHPDSFRIVNEQDGRILLSSNGLQSGRKLYSFFYNPPSLVRVDITASRPDSAWEWRMSCPGFPLP